MKWILTLTTALLLCLAAFAEVKTHIQYDGEIRETKMVDGLVDGKKVKIAVVNGFLPKDISETTEKNVGLESRSFRFEKKAPFKQGMKIEYIKNPKLRPLGISESTTDAQGKTTEGPSYMVMPYILKE